MHEIGNWFYHYLGLGGTGPWYAWWSGAFADITILGAAIGIYKKHKCKTCPRLAHHTVEGTSWRTCHWHSTDAHHAKLFAHHERKHPEQHAFLAGRKSD